MSNLKFKNQTGFYRGKVRDVYSIGEDLLVMIASDRISAFDVILPRPIPFKGQVLNQIASHMLEATRDIGSNWLLATPAPTVSIGKKCVPFKIEMVVRGYLSGHAWRTYKSGERILCGVEMADRMNENDQFVTPIITPSTKAAKGHDEDIDAKTIVESGLASKDEWTKLCMLALQLFERGTQIAAERGLILVDTKYEFGKIGNEIYLMDEVHTPDSSRYFFSAGYNERQLRGERQPQLSKEFVREWLIENNYMGKEGQGVPAMSDHWVETISKRYIELYEKVIGRTFKPEALSQEELFNRTAVALQQIQ
ncbi:MAG: phosphoribosylaminoimidazolesuccinocarboxamide synthase [Bacteroidetes bacterium]|nr:phosphoribosylaminoimidazolesuccinocarboxamide synthase [Bacteroidota bacterium]